MKVLILTSATPANVYLVNQLLERHTVVGMVIESPPPALTAEQKYQRRRQLIQRHGWLRTFNKLAYNWLRWRFISREEAATVERTLFPDGQPVRYTRAIPTVTVETINAPVCVDFIRDLAPDVLAVCGTTVIKPEVFTLAPRGAVNIHTGITPDYRSADPIFWALYNSEPDKVGVTIHFIDRGIDTGPILRQEAVPLYSDDTMTSIYVRCIRRGAELYLQVLDALSGGPVKPLDRSGVKGRAFYSINLGILQYLLFRWRFGRLKRRLPRGNSAADISAEARP